jgi:cellulose synthase (UDP-forming)
MSPVRRPRGTHERPQQPPDGEDSAEFDALTREITALSGGAVVGLRPSGPVFGGKPPSRRTSRHDTFVHALSARARVTIGLLTIGWLASVVVFWLWWLAPGHRLGWTGMIINSALLGYLCLLPSYFIVGANRLRKVDPAREVPSLRVAIVVTKAPSEPWPVARGTLEAMLRQDYPHPYDVWLCDENPSEDVIEWCTRHGVSVSTRRDATDYHRATWPRRTRCKEGNLAYFYDRVGYRDYDVVSQLDCDHVPQPDYLAQMVRPFADPAIGYVSAPSVCDLNAAESWAARGRLHREASFHGPFQLGYNAELAPLCIGSHYAVRTAALCSIGGVGPELAEDFSTSYLLNVAGWGGAFAIDAEAHGEGPPTFAAMLTQEFQWSRSLCVVLLGLIPRTVCRLPGTLQVRFLFALSYYPLLVFSSAVGLLLPPVAAVSGLPWVNVGYVDFLAHWVAVSVWLILITAVLRKSGTLRPPDAPVFSWELWLYSVVRWPLVGWGMIAAAIQQILRVPMEFKVTPKGKTGAEPLQVRLLAPYVAISLALSGAAIAGMVITGTFGYIGLCLIGSVTYWICATAVALLHWWQVTGFAEMPPRRSFATVRFPLAVCLLAAAPLALALITYPGYLWRELGL